MTLRRAAQQALEALEGVFEGDEKGAQYWTVTGGTYEAVYCKHAITALKAALEQPEQEPVAWIDDSGHPKHRLYRQSATEQRLYGLLRPLYTHPPRREWRGLTEEEIEDCWDGYLSDYQLQMIRTIESKLKERNA
jgi:hypothetical protein